MTAVPFETRRRWRDHPSGPWEDPGNISAFLSQWNLLASPRSTHSGVVSCDLRYLVIQKSTWTGYTVEVDGPPQFVDLDNVEAGVMSWDHALQPGESVPYLGGNVVRAGKGNEGLIVRMAGIRSHYHEQGVPRGAPFWSTHTYAAPPDSPFPTGLLALRAASDVYSLQGHSAEAARLDALRDAIADVVRGDLWVTLGPDQHAAWRSALDDALSAELPSRPLLESILAAASFTGILAAHYLDPLREATPSGSDALFSNRDYLNPPGGPMDIHSDLVITAVELAGMLAGSAFQAEQQVGFRALKDMVDGDSQLGAILATQRLVRIGQAISTDASGHAEWVTWIGQTVAGGHFRAMSIDAARVAAARLCTDHKVKVPAALNAALPEKATLHV